MTDTPNTAQLLPCPFCGGEASAAGFQVWSKPLDDMWWDGGDPITEAYFCNCTRCGLDNRSGGVGRRTRIDAIDAWNARADLALTGQTLTQVREALKTIVVASTCASSRAQARAALALLNAQSK